MTDWIWIEQDVALAIHEEQLSEHGGSIGTRDIGLLESAMARPTNIAAYGEPDIAELAAAYGYGIARNHPFVDGNKRTAFVVAELFLMLNGSHLHAADSDCIAIMLEVAAGEIEEAAFAQWIRDHIGPESVS